MLEDAAAVSSILAVARERTGADFSRYRAATVHRRIRNRMLSIGAESLQSYLALLESSRDEAAELLARAGAGHEVRLAYEAAEGIEIAREFHPEMLLCDIGLPDMDGYQVARRFRTDEPLKSAFLIAVTGYAGAEDRARAERAGFDRHLGKPLDLETLNALLARLGA